ncbi:hypothetical protein NEOKW01_1864 [Nematocida sp. AWRm80]|nr:hypothetical protein NEOKW01_1864 [Nematocida sp. AWRm80]
MAGERNNEEWYYRKGRRGWYSRYDTNGYRKMLTPEEYYANYDDDRQYRWTTARRYRPYSQVSEREEAYNNAQAGQNSLENEGSTAGASSRPNLYDSSQWNRQDNNRFSEGIEGPDRRESNGIGEYGIPSGPMPAPNPKRIQGNRMYAQPPYRAAYYLDGTHHRGNSSGGRAIDTYNRQLPYRNPHTLYGTAPHTNTTSQHTQPRKQEHIPPKNTQQTSTEGTEDSIQRDAESEHSTSSHNPERAKANATQETTIATNTPNMLNTPNTISKSTPNTLTTLNTILNQSTIEDTRLNNRSDNTNTPTSTVDINNTAEMNNHPDTVEKDNESISKREDTDIKEDSYGNTPNKTEIDSTMPNSYKESDLSQLEDSVDTVNSAGMQNEIQTNPNMLVNSINTSQDGHSERVPESDTHDPVSTDIHSEDRSILKGISASISLSTEEATGITAKIDPANPRYMESMPILYAYVLAKKQVEEEENEKISQLNNSLLSRPQKQGTTSQEIRYWENKKKLRDLCIEAEDISLLITAAIQRSKINESKIPLLEPEVVSKYLFNSVHTSPKQAHTKASTISLYAEEEQQIKKAFAEVGKNFVQIRERFLPWRTAKEIVQIYYQYKYIFRLKYWQNAYKDTRRLLDEDLKEIIEREWSLQEKAEFELLFPDLGKRWSQYAKALPNKTEGDLRAFYKYYKKFILKAQKDRTKPQAKENITSPSDATSIQWKAHERQMFALLFPHIGKNWNVLANYIITKNASEIRSYHRAYYKNLSIGERILETHLKDIGEPQIRTDPLPLKHKQENLVVPHTISAGILFEANKQSNIQAGK